MSKLPPQYADDVRRAVETLRRGGVILYPTDTIWGLGCDARRSDAVRRIFDIKHRADSKALITLVSSLPMLDRTVASVPEVAEQLIEVSDTPITIIYDRGTGVAPELLAPDGSIGVRLTREAVSAAICDGLGAPIVSTSANISGSPSPADFSGIAPEIIGAVDYVCTSRRLEHPAGAKPSTIIKISDGGLFTIIRK